MTKTCENERCGKDFQRRSTDGYKYWESRRFCSVECFRDAFRSTVVEDVEWIIDHDHPESIAKRVGYGDARSLINKLHKMDAEALAEKLARNLDRYQRGLISHSGGDVFV